MSDEVYQSQKKAFKWLAGKRSNSKALNLRGDLNEFAPALGFRCTRKCCGLPTKTMNYRGGLLRPNFGLQTEHLQFLAAASWLNLGEKKKGLAQREWIKTLTYQLNKFMCRQRQCSL